MRDARTKKIELILFISIFLFLIPFVSQAKDCSHCWCLISPDKICEHHTKEDGTTGQNITTKDQCDKYCFNRSTDAQTWSAVHCDDSYIDWNSKDQGDPCFANTTAAPANDDVKVLPFQAIEPRLSIPEIDLKYSAVLTQEGDQRYITVPYLAEYIASLYQYLVGVATVLAIIMIMYGGFRWIFQGGGGAGQATEAKNTIIGAVVGLALALGSYTVLNLINPDLVTFKALRLEIVDREEFSLGFSYADPTPEQEEGVIAEPATSTPSGGTSRDKLLSVCKSRSAGGTVTASDLKAILKTWIDIGTVGGATYIRGGFTKQSACTNNAQKDYALKILNDQGIKIPEGAAHEDLKQLYQQEIVDKVFEDGRLCGDCVSWTQQLFECAGMGYQLRFPAMKSRKEQYLKYRISTSDNSCAEARDNIPGGIKFGDIIHYRNLSDAGHMVTYIGDNGISGLEDYEIVEMGGAKSAKCEIVKGLNNALNCVRIHKTWSGWNKKKKFCDIFRVLGN